MHLSLQNIIVALTATSIVVTAQSSCPQRKAWVTLTDAEKKQFVDAIVALKKSGRYDQFVSTHMANSNTAHGNALGVPIPYWAWEGDSQAPHRADVFKWLGRDGQGPNNCVQDGPFTVANGFSNTVGSPGCLRRCFNGGNNTMQPIDSPEVIAALISQSNDYSAFRQNLEGGPHARIHNAIAYPCGGDMAHMHSPNDPIFWLHHSNVDRMFARWQASCPSHKNTFPLPLTQKLSDFDFTWGDAALDGRLCHNYGPNPADAPISPRCSGGSGQPGDNSTTPGGNSTTPGGNSTDTTPRNTVGDTWLLTNLRLLVPSSAIVNNASSGNLLSSILTKRDTIYSLDAANVTESNSTVTIDNQLQNQTVAATELVSNVTATNGTELTQNATTALNTTETPTVNATFYLPNVYEELMKTASNASNSSCPIVYKPLDDVNVTAPAPKDLSDEARLRYPFKIPADWLKMMKIDTPETQAFYVYSKHIIDKVNNSPDYISPGSLEKQKERLEHVHSHPPRYGRHRKCIRHAYTNMNTI